MTVPVIFSGFLHDELLLLLPEAAAHIRTPRDIAVPQSTATSRLHLQYTPGSPHLALLLPLGDTICELTATEQISPLDLTIRSRGGWLLSAPLPFPRHATRDRWLPPR